MPTPPIYLGADHAGFSLKEAVKAHLLGTGHRVVDLSPAFIEGDDYPLIAKQVARQIVKEKALGLLVCGTGHGMDIAANRINGARAIVARTEEDAALSREHNHANILVLGGRTTKPAKAKTIVNTWLATPPSRAARHVRRVADLDS